jgi:hypothetical protein
MNPVVTESSWIQKMRALLPPDEVSFEAHRLLSSLSPDLTSILPKEKTTSVRLYGVDSGFFYLPLALSEWAGNSNHEQLKDLAVTVAIGHAHFAIMDRVFDEHQIEAPMVALAHTMLVCYLHRMENGYGSSFDTDLEHCRHYQPYALAALHEDRNRFQLRAIETDDLHRLGMKSAPACMPIGAILHAAGMGQKAEDAEAAFLTYSAALQLLDDLADMADDSRNGLSSIPLNLLYVNALGLTTWPQEQAFTVDDLRALSVLSGVRSACLRIAKSLLERTVQAATESGLDPMAEIAQVRLNRVLLLLSRVSS